MPGLRFDGASLQLTRRTPGGLQLVVWSLRDGRWLRWAGPSADRGRELQDSWLRSQQLQGSETAQLAVLEGVSEWQVYFFRGNAWSNAQSSGDLAAPAPGASAPARAGLARRRAPGADFAEGSGFAGAVTRDTVLGPQQP